MILCFGGAHAKVAHRVMDDERPAHDLRADIECLRNDTSQVSEVHGEMPDGLQKMNVSVLPSRPGKLAHGEDQQEAKNN